MDRFDEEHAEVPSLWHLELANALAMGERNKHIAPARASEFIALIDGLPIVVDERTPNIALSSVLELSRRERLSPMTPAISNLPCAAASRLLPRTTIWRGRLTTWE